MQLPVGIVLDRYGPRRVEPVLLAIAASGAALFSFSETIAGLTIARAVIGAGVCACLMAPLKAIAAWYPADRQASYAGWIMVAGGLGALAATVPVELALRITSWRVVFALLSAITLAVALFIFLRVPDIEKPAESGGIRAQVAGVRDVMLPSALLVDRAPRRPRHGLVHGDPGPLGRAVDDGSGRPDACRGGRSPAGYECRDHGRLLHDWPLRHAPGAPGHPRAAHVRHGLRAQPCGTRADRLPGTRRFARGGRCTAWALRPTCSGSRRSTKGSRVQLTGRANTTLNLFMFGGSFAVQWGIGIVVDAVAGVDRPRHGRAACASRSPSCSRATRWPSCGSSSAGRKAPRDGIA